MSEARQELPPIDSGSSGIWQPSSPLAPFRYLSVDYYASNGQATAGAGTRGNLLIDWSGAQPPALQGNVGYLSANNGAWRRRLPLGFRGHFDLGSVAPWPLVLRKDDGQRFFAHVAADVEPILEAASQAISFSNNGGDVVASLQVIPGLDSFGNPVAQPVTQAKSPIGNYLPIIVAEDDLVMFTNPLNLSLPAVGTAVTLLNNPGGASITVGHSELWVDAVSAGTHLVVRDVTANVNVARFPIMTVTGPFRLPFQYNSATTGLTIATVGAAAAVQVTGWLNAGRVDF